MYIQQQNIRIQIVQVELADAASLVELPGNS